MRGRLPFCSSLKSVFISKAVGILGQWSFVDCSSLRSVVFESESKLGKIESEAFRRCTALESLCLQSSVTAIFYHAFSQVTSLISLTFESGSNLKKIHGNVFSNCLSLKSLFLPASVSVINGSAFIDSSIEEIYVDDANPNYFVSGPFLIGVARMSLIRYFGDSGDVTLESLSDLGLTQIGSYAFSNCSILKSICIPTLITSLGRDSFSYCFSLSQIIFQSDSFLSQMGFGTFSECPSLISICIPAKVESLPNACFWSCDSLAQISFEPGSKLTRIHPGAFAGCYSLRSLVIPAQLEILTYDMICHCKLLCELIFEIPSHLKQLDLQVCTFGSLCIPDSVEIVVGKNKRHRAQRRLLQFGRESNLREINWKEPNSYCPFIWMLRYS
jgi:hypothetical protein